MKRAEERRLKRGGKKAASTAYETGGTHQDPQQEADDARHFEGLYVTAHDWPQIKKAMCEGGVLSAATCGLRQLV